MGLQDKLIDVLSGFQFDNLEYIDWCIEYYSLGENSIGETGVRKFVSR